MDPDRYCLDEAAPPGSSLHYATLFASPRDRAAVVAVHALRLALLRIIDTIADPDVRARKLNWWSGEILEARDGRAHHPITVAIARHGGGMLRSLPEVLGMLSAVARVSAGNGLASETTRRRFCEDLGGGTAALCAAAIPPMPDDHALQDIRALGTVLERAMLAGAPLSRSGLMDIAQAVPQVSPHPHHHPGLMAGLAISASTRQYTTSASAPVSRVATGPDPDPILSAASRPADPDCEHRDGPAPEWLADERFGACRALTDMLNDMPHRSDPVALIYRILARIRIAALTNALRRSTRASPRRASITPIRKLWIAWRTMHRAG